MTDAQIVRQMQAGKQDALEHMISRYHSYVYTIIVNMVGDYGSSAAEELTSDTFMAVWNHSEGIQSDKLKQTI